MAKVSILMNGYNAEKYLKEAIDSIYNQTFSDWEIIFIDNCSVDNTKKIVKNYNDKIKYYKTDVNISLGAARNFGLNFCHGEYIAFLDTDDIWIYDKLQKQINMMDNSDEEYKLCYGGVIYIDKNSNTVGQMLPRAISGNVFVQQLKRYEINMQSVLLRNYKNIKFNETLRHSPDFDLFMDIILENKAIVIKEAIVKYRKLEDSLTSKNIEFWWIEMKYTLDRLFASKQFKNEYMEFIKIAYAKVAYNKARYLISINKKKEASAELSKYKFVSLEYFAIFLISLFPKKIWNLVHEFK
jgi:glycosyltransferase involved in cell wall biosynthesis